MAQVSAKLAPSVVNSPQGEIQLIGFSGDITQLTLVVGTCNPGPPAVFGDFSNYATWAWFQMGTLTLVRRAGVNQLVGADAWSWAGVAEADNAWVTYWPSLTVPGPTDPLPAVAGPFVVGP